MQDFNGETLLVGDRVAFINNGVLSNGYVRGQHISGAISVGILISGGGYLLFTVSQEKLTIINS